MTQKQKKVATKVMGLLTVISLLIIFKGFVFSTVDKVIVPITESVMPNNYLVLAVTFLFVVSAYLAKGVLIYRKSYLKHPEHSLCIAAIAIVFYSVFRFSDHYFFYGIGNLAYVDVAVITAFVLDVLSYFLPVIKKPKKNENVNVFVSDNPSLTDELGRSDYAEMLVDKIYATYKSGNLFGGSMTILLNERYGAGKTTFFNLIEGKAKGIIRTCVFKPWQTDSGMRMTEELLRLLEEQYAISNQLVKHLEGYSKLLSGSEAKGVLGFVSHLLSEKDSLAQRYDSIRRQLQTINDPLVVLVDDVDRLQAEELLALLKLLRNGADFPNIIYLVAADKEAMSQMLETKGIKNSDEYLKKFFNFELLFPIDDSFLKSLLRNQIVSTLSGYYGVRFSMPSVEKEILTAQIVQNVFRSPRDVYRFINLLTYSLDLFKRYGILEDVNVQDLLKLLLIQFISPVVYKILRDEMDLLLDIRGNDGRVHLKEGYKDVIISRQFKRQLQDVLSRVKQRNPDVQDEPVENDVEAEDLTLFDIPAQERPSNEDIVSELLRDMFYDTLNYRSKDRICFISEYFKFFAGKYSKQELSLQYMKDLMEVSSDAVFDDTMGKAIIQGKSEFLIHKLKQYIEDERIGKDIPLVLQRCIKIQDAVYRDWAQSYTSANSPKDFNLIGYFRPVYSNLLLTDKRNVVTDIEEIERIKALYADNKSYPWLASSLCLKQYLSEERDVTFVYGQDVFLELRESLIRRFITVELAQKPFEKEKIEAIPLLRDIYNVYWDEQFKEYIKRYSEPMEWLYILLKPSGDTLCWNRLYYDNLVGDGMLDYYAQDYWGLDLSKELKDDLAQVSGRNNEASFTATNFGHHPFLVAAKKWWDEKDIIKS